MNFETAGALLSISYSADLNNLKEKIKNLLLECESKEAAEADIFSLCRRINLVFLGEQKFRLNLKIYSKGQLIVYLKKLLEINPTNSHQFGFKDTEILRPPQLGILFGGIDTNLSKVGLDLYQRNSTFKEVIDEMDALSTRNGGPSLSSLIYGENVKLLNSVRFYQIALLTIQVAMFKTWVAWGVNPSFIVGRSGGEIAALVASGVISLKDAFKIVDTQTAIVSQLPLTANLLKVFASEEMVLEVLGGLKTEASVSLIYSPSLCFVVCKRESTNSILALFNARNIKCINFDIQHVGYHSPLIDSVLNQIESLPDGVEFSKPSIKYISSILGGFVDGTVSTKEYWVNYVRAPVRFSQSMHMAQASGCEMILEICPPRRAQANFWTEKFGMDRYFQSFSEDGSALVGSLETILKLASLGFRIDWKRFTREM